MRTRLSIILATLTIGLVLPAAPLLAVPVACPSECIVSDGPASMTFDGLVLTSLTVNGIDQLSQQGLLLTLGVNSPANPLTGVYLEQELPVQSATQDEDTNQIVVMFSDGALSVTVTYTLVGAPQMATVDYLVRLQNIGFADQAMALTDFIDFDLMGNNSGDTVSFSPNVITQTGKGATATATSVGAIDYHDVGECCLFSTLSRTVDGHLSDANGPVGPDDVTGSFQNNIELPEQSAFTIARRLQVTTAAPNTIAPAPALSPLALAAALLALAGVAGMTLRRRG